MCVIIHKPADVEVPLATLKKCWQSNPHGAGFMYSNAGSLVLVNGLMSLNDVVHEYALRECVRREVVIHFRLASAGAITPEQTHPFWVFQDQLAFAHNGHMEGFTRGVEQSDTMVFNKELLSKLPHNFLNNEAIVELLSTYIAGSVMVFMDRVGSVKKLGFLSSSVTIDGVWYSNGYWEEEEEYESDSTFDADEVIVRELMKIQKRMDSDKSDL